jgi:hypothetical protein
LPREALAPSLEDLSLEEATPSLAEDPSLEEAMLSSPLVHGVLMDMDVTCNGALMDMLLTLVETPLLEEDLSLADQRVEAEASLVEYLHFPSLADQREVSLVSPREDPAREEAREVFLVSLREDPREVMYLEDPVCVP